MKKINRKKLEEEFMKKIKEIMENIFKDKTEEDLIEYCTFLTVDSVSEIR